MYEVRERYALSGDGSLLSGEPDLTRLKQKTLLALAKSYVESSTPISGPGLQSVSCERNWSDKCLQCSEE
jgi:hypothetical protein